ncbi:MAG: class I SAM-dependent methyltransferase [Brevibacterium sp.]|nr:class I SAM-dependent methyltransferase [Brevibacterium sp.]
MITASAELVEVAPRKILDLGVGSGLTARRVAEALPQTHILGICPAAPSMWSCRPWPCTISTVRARPSRWRRLLPQGAIAG